MTDNYYIIYNLFWGDSNSVNITDDAQFGISPNNALRNGANIEFLKNMRSIILLGTYSNARFRINVIVFSVTNG